MTKTSTEDIAMESAHRCSHGRLLAVLIAQVDAVSRRLAYDPLTGAASRQTLEEAAARELARFNRYGHPVALIVADLDDFKQTNYRCGHQAGDEALKRFAEVLRSNTRYVDRVARWSGDEFALLLPNTGGTLAKLTAERLCGRQPLCDSKLKRTRRHPAARRGPSFDPASSERQAATGLPRALRSMLGPVC